MATTAAITLSSATATPSKLVDVTCTVSNSGASAVTVRDIVAIVTPTTATTQAVAASPGTPVIQPGVNSSVAAGGSTAYHWKTTAFAPPAASVGGLPASYVYDIGARVRMSDGSTVDASTATLTVAPS